MTYVHQQRFKHIYILCKFAINNDEHASFDWTFKRNYSKYKFVSCIEDRGGVTLQLCKYVNLLMLSVNPKQRVYITIFCLWLVVVVSI